MEKKIFLIGTLFFVFISFSQAQSTSSAYLVRAATVVSGSSEKIFLGKKEYVVQQSIGQSSVIGTLVNGNLVLRQGFIQPNVLSKIADKTTPVNLEAVLYPNPFFESISLLFNEAITSKISVEVFDITGRLLYTEEFGPSQKLDVVLGSFPVSNYILKVKANDKQFIKKIIKK